MHDAQDKQQDIHARFRVLRDFVLDTTLSLECTGLVLFVLSGPRRRSRAELLARLRIGADKLRRIANEAIDAGYCIPSSDGFWFTDRKHTRTNRSRLIFGFSGHKLEISDALRWAIWERDDFRCAHCGARSFLAVDHVYPECLGGTNSPENLQTLCRVCNSRKGGRA